MGVKKLVFEFDRKMRDMKGSLGFLQLENLARNVFQSLETRKQILKNTKNIPLMGNRLQSMYIREYHAVFVIICGTLWVGQDHTGTFYQPPEILPHLMALTK